MIKSLLDDEDPNDAAEEKKRGFLRKDPPKPEILSIIPDDDSGPAEKPGESSEDLRNAFRGDPVPDPPKLDLPPAPGGTAQQNNESLSESARKTVELERKLREIEEELRAEKERLGLAPRRPKGASSGTRGPEHAAGPIRPSADRPEIKVPFSDPEPRPFEPEPAAETYRKSGLAWSAGIALFGSVVFMLVVGWFADLLLDTSPWGVVAGTVIGSVIGFVQLFRISSQILRPQKSDFEKVSLVARDDADGAAND